jgi:hypothetical protein
MVYTSVLVLEKCGYHGGHRGAQGTRTGVSLCFVFTLIDNRSPKPLYLWRLSYSAVSPRGGAGQG